MQALRSPIRVSLRTPWIAFLGVVLGASLVYLNTLGNGFVYDDHYVVVQNQLVKTLDPLEIFTREYWSGFTSQQAGTYYRPLTILSFATDYAIWGPDPFGFHLTNLLLHALASGLFYLLCCRLIRNRTAAVFAALLFAVHPVHTEVVSNISGRSDLLFSLFSLASICCFIHSGRSSAVATALACLLASFSKETAVLLPFFFVFCDLIWKPHSSTFLALYFWQRIRAVHIWTFSALAFFLALRTFAIGNLQAVLPSPMDNPLVDAPFSARILTLPVLVFHYLRLLVAPISLSPDYSFNQIPVVTTPVHGLFLIGTLILALVSLAVARCWDRSRIGIFGVGLTVFPLILALNPFVSTGSILAEQYLYLPSAGFCLLVALMALRLRPTWLTLPRHQWVNYLVAFLVLTAGAYRTVVRNQDWRNDKTLFQAAVQDSPNSVRSRLNLAFLFVNEKDHSGAIREYRQILRIRGDYPVIHRALLPGRPVPSDWKPASGTATLSGLPGILDR
ncbi:MAG: DUF1736 domain-containing protein [bacterium]|nr:DUF1736 domain-containing protein [bacterium]